MGATARGTGSYGGAISAATIADIRARIVPGGLIYYSDIAAIYDGLNNASGHTHSYYDQYYGNTYGNKALPIPPYTGGVGSTTDSASATAGGGLSSKIYASEVNNMNTMASDWQNHSHTFTDSAPGLPGGYS